MEHSGTKVTYTTTTPSKYLRILGTPSAYSIKGQNALVAGGLLAEGVTSIAQEKPTLWLMS